MELKIISPERSQDKISCDLRELTRVLIEKFNIETGYGLGGEFGYGVDYENDTFRAILNYHKISNSSGRKSVYIGLYFSRILSDPI